MKPLPLYDASAAIACTISEAELPQRLAQLEKMRTFLESIERTAEGMLLRFPATGETEDLLEDFVRGEKACCQFWGFRIDRDEVALSLTWAAPPSAEPILDRLADFFEGAEPAVTLSGLL